MTRLEQQMKALERANEVRVGGAGVRREIKGMGFDAGCERIAELLTERASSIDAARVGWLLRSVYGAGYKRATRWLVAAGIRSGECPVRDLTDRQRTVLADALFRSTVRRVR